MRICRRVFLVGMSLSLVLAGCIEADKSSEATISKLTLTMDSKDYPIDFGTNTTATVVLPAGAIMPNSATVKMVELAPGAKGLAKDQKLTLTEGSVIVTITAEDGTTTNDYTVSITLTEGLDATTFSYTAVKATEGVANTAGVDPEWDAGHLYPTNITYSITGYVAESGAGNNGSGNTVLIAPATGKITITAQAEAANSGTYTVTATAGSDSNYVQNSMRTAPVTVKVMESLSNYSLSYPMAKHSADGSISVSPIWKKGSADEAPDSGGVSYGIDPALPTGLTLNADGTISGTVSTMLSLDKVTEYQITVTGNNIDYEGTDTGIFLDKFLLGEYSQVAPATGTAISNIDDLKAMTQTPDGEYYLTAHIDLTGETWTPIASSANPFTGKLHGNGYAIYNLTIDAETATHQGLFASVSDATIDNLSIGVANIKGKAVVGALAGFASNATLSNVAVAPMTANASIETAGDETIETVSGAHLGGLVGIQAGGSLNGYSQVTVIGTNSGNNVGGLVGYVTTGSSVSGYATGDVTGASGYIGGLVGNNNNSSVTGYATGNVAGSNDIGGLVGRVTTGGSVSGYATGDIVRGFSTLGGLVGYSAGSVTGYATGAVPSGTGTGGLIGNAPQNSVGYWDKQSTGHDTSAGGATAVGISKTQNIVFVAATATTSASYTDSGNSNTIFDNTAFTDVFDTENGASKTWPKLKSSYTFNSIDFNFDFPQPTVTVSASDADTIEVAY